MALFVKIHNLYSSCFFIFTRGLISRSLETYNRRMHVKSFMKPDDCRCKHACVYYDRDRVKEKRCCSIFFALPKSIASILQSFFHPCLQYLSKRNRRKKSSPTKAIEYIYTR